MAEFIDREKYCSYLESRECEFLDDFGKGWNEGWKAAKRVALKFPAADVAPVVHGHWIYKRTYGCLDENNCSLCGQLMTTLHGRLMPFCPGCWAKMDGVEPNPRANVQPVRYGQWLDGRCTA